MSLSTQSLIERSVTAAVRHLRAGERLMMVGGYQDIHGEIHEVHVQGQDEEEILTRLREAVPLCNVVSFAAAGDVRLATPTGQPIQAVTIYWQDRTKQSVQVEAVAYLKIGREVRLDLQRATWTPLHESWINRDDGVSSPNLSAEQNRYP